MQGGIVRALLSVVTFFGLVGLAQLMRMMCVVSVTRVSQSATPPKRAATPSALATMLRRRFNLQCPNSTRNLGNYKA